MNNEKLKCARRSSVKGVARALLDDRRPHLEVFPSSGRVPGRRLRFEAAASRRRVDGAGVSGRFGLALRGNFSGSDAVRIGRVCDRAHLDALGRPSGFVNLHGGNGVRSV